jgi:lipid-binding SYLF domain-containing protein
MHRIQLLLLLAVLLSLSVVAVAQDPDREAVVSRLDSAATILNEVMAAPDKAIPQGIVESAECVAILPSMVKGGFIAAISLGKGVATCRTKAGWSAPAFFNVRGGSLGLQAGGQAVDLIMLIMNEQGMKNLLSSKFKLGADASVAAGPVGRHAEGMTDYKLKAQVLIYSRARGVFAGISLNGAVVRQDRDDTRLFYGRMVPFGKILTGETPVPAEAQGLLRTVAKYASPAQPQVPAQPPQNQPGAAPQIPAPPPSPEQQAPTQANPPPQQEAPKPF